MIFKAKINTTNVALNISCKAGSLRNAKNFAFDCKTYCCKTRMYGTVKNAPIYMYYVAPETPMMSSVIVDCPDLVPPQYFGQVYAYAMYDECMYISLYVFMHACMHVSKKQIKSKIFYSHVTVTLMNMNNIIKLMKTCFSTCIPR